MTFSVRWLLTGALAMAACTRGSDSGGLDPYGNGDGDGAGDGDGDGDDDDDGDHGTLGEGEFELTADFDGPCEARELVDVNLGHTAESAVRALHCQIAGTEPDEGLVSEWAGQLRSQEYVRRIRPEMVERVRFAISPLGDDGVAIGAARLAALARA